MNENEVIISLALAKIKKNLSRIEEINIKLKELEENKSKNKIAREDSQKAEM